MIKKMAFFLTVTSLLVFAVSVQAENSFENPISSGMEARGHIGGS